MFKFFENQKAISPVVATALLLVVAVVSVVGFQGWFDNFNSELLVGIEQDSGSSFNSVKVEGIINDVLYLNSKGDSELSLLSVVDSSGVEQCSFSGDGEVNNSGLVGHWTFDDNSNVISDKSGNGNDGKLFGNSHLLLDFDSGDSSDKTSYGNDGIVNGATWGNSDCVSGGCYSFDGVDDYIESNLSHLNFDNDFTISLWFNLNEFFPDENSINGKMLLSKTNLSDGFVIAIKNNSNKFVIRTEIRSDSTPVLISGEDIKINMWYNLILVKKGYDYVYYLNSNYVGNFYTNKSIDVPSAKLDIGRVYWWSPSYFNGSIDEIGIYSSALSSSQVLDLYNSQKVKFMEFTSRGVEFDGKDDYVLTPFISDEYNSKTILYFSSRYETKQQRLGVHDTNNHRFYLGHYVDNSFYCGIGDSYTSNVKPSNYNTFSKLNSFMFLVCSGNGSLAKGYVNAEEVTSFSYSYSGVSSRPFVIGAAYYGTSILPSEHMSGIIDEVRIYNRSLSQKEIDNLFWYFTNSQKVGINKIDLSSCNLNKNEKYNVVGFAGNNKIDVEVISK